MRIALRLLLRRARRYLLRDFVPGITPDASAPLASPRTCVPGPGTLTISDVQADASIVGGVLTVAARAAAGRTFYVTNVPHRAGRAVLATLTWTSGGGYLALGFYTGTLGSYAGVLSSGYVFPTSGASVMYLPAVFGATPKRVAVVRTESGRHLYLGDGRLMWVDTDTDTAARTAAVSSYQDAATVRSLYLCDLRDIDSRFGPDYGLATQRVATPDAATITHEANALIEWTTPPVVAGQVYELSVRQTNADNRWIIRGDQAAGTIKLFERNNAVETERASASQTWTVGNTYRIVVVADGTTIQGYVADSWKWQYTSATFNQTATTAMCSHAGGANLVSWPRYVTLPAGV